MRYLLDAHTLTWSQDDPGKLSAAEIPALEAKLAKARQVKQGMMQELLTGWIRLQ